MRRSLIVDVSGRLIVLSAVAFSLYLVSAGHNQPGGGFVGGLVAGAAVALAYVAGALDDVRRLIPMPPWTVLGAGLSMVALVSLLPMAFGGSLLEQGYTTLHPPVLGEVKLTSALVFDTGVYAVVVGIVFMAFEALGEESQPEDPEAVD